MYCDSEKWDKRYLALAQHVATWSKDPQTQVGCVIVNCNGGIVACGFNGFPHGHDDSPELYLDAKHKILNCVHAEDNALRIANIPRYETGARLYVTFPPCTRCAQLIADYSQIKKVVYLAPNHEKIRAERGEQYLVDLLVLNNIAFEILHKANIFLKAMVLDE